QELDYLLRAFRLRLPLDTRVDVLGVFTEDHHVGLFGLLERAGYAPEVAHRAQAYVEVELLAQRDVDRANSAADRCGERSLDRNDELARGLESFVWQPDMLSVDFAGLLPGVHLHPLDAAPAAIGNVDRCVHHPDHHRSNVDAGTVALDERNNGTVRNS